MSSELGSLVQLAINEGVSPGELTTQIKKEVLDQYIQKFPKAPITTEVLVDVESGKIRLISQDEDVTPISFKVDAERIAREVVIKSLESGKANKGIKKEETEKQAYKIDFPGTVFLFWGYHLFYLLYLGLLTLSFVFSGALGNIFDFSQNRSWFQLIYWIILITTPLITIGFVIKNHLSKQGQALSRLFFRVEIPTLFLTGVSLFLTTLSMPIINSFLLILVITPIFVYLNRKGLVNLPPKKQRVAVWIALFIALTLIYGLILWTFVVPLFTGTIAKLFFEDFFADLIRPYARYGGIGSMPVDILGQLIGFAFRLTGFVMVMTAILLPYVFIYKILKSWLRDAEALSQVWGEKKFIKEIVVGTIVWLGMVVVFSVQSGYPRSAKQLAALMKAQSFEERQKIAQELTTKKGETTTDLKAVYERRQNYILTKDNDFLSQGYEEILSLPPTMAKVTQTLFLAMAYPFVYQEKVPWQELETAYDYMYGHSLWGASISGGVSTNNVQLVSREVRVDSQNQSPLGKVTIEETFNNPQFSDQEVIYEFTLPPEAVVTGLKLGPNLEYEGQIAPRGAAQQIYQQELVQRRDPALLETIGPSLYRLRIFPIPGNNNVGMVRGGINQKIQMIYLTPLTPEGYGLPRMIRKQNLTNDKNIKLSAQIDGDWVNLDKTSAEIPLTPGLKEKLCQIKWSEKDSVNLNVTQAAMMNFEGQNLCQAGLPQGSTPIKLAILVDTSANAGNQKVMGELAKLKEIPDNYQIEVIPFNDLTGQPQSLTKWHENQTKQATNFGKHSLSALNKFVKQGDYDAYIVITGKQFSGDEWQTWSVPKKAPIYLIPSQGGVSLDPERITTMIQSGSYIFANVNEALRYAYQAKLVSQDQGMPGMYWWTKLTNEPKYDMSQLPGLMLALGNIETASASVQQVATQALMQQALKAYSQPVTQNLALLDAWHKLAQDAHFITPYSSLIALVNERQQANLDDLSNDYNRFDEQEFRQNQGGGGIIGVPQPPGMRITDPLSLMMPSMMKTEFMGTDLLGPGATIPTSDVGNIGLAGPMATSYGGGSIFSLPGGLSGIFILVNILLLGGGGLVWVGQKIKAKRKT